MNPANITAVVVTRQSGEHLEQVMESLRAAGFGEILVWDNCQEVDCKVYGRYVAAERAAFDVVYVQDDDCIVDAAAVCRNYEPGAVTCNWPEPHRSVNANLYRGGIALVGWGAVFDKALLDSFDDYHEMWDIDDLFLRECDRVFTALNRVNLIEVPMRHLPSAEGPDRMWRERRHLGDLEAIKDRIAAARKVAA